MASSPSQFGSISPALGLGTINEIIDALPVLVDTVDERVSTQMKSLLPDFVTGDHPTFSAFVQAYFEWMEQEGNPRYASVKHLSNRDIDDTTSAFIEHFNSEYLHGFPAEFSTEVNERVAIKQIGDLYRAKGGEKAVILLFRLLFNETVTVIRPGENMLGLSSAFWDDPFTIQISRSNGITNALDAIGHTLFQTKTGRPGGEVESSGFASDGRMFTHEAIDVAEYELKSVVGKFNPNKPIFYTIGNTTREETVFPMVSSIGISNGGTGYAISDRIVVRDTVRNTRVAEAVIANVDNKGAITSLRLSKRYPNYVEGNALDFDFITGATTDVTPGGTGATLNAENAVGVFQVGRYTVSKDVLGSNDRIQDNHYYQKYSYSVRTNQGIEDFRESIKDIAHPAGYKVFADTILGASGDGFTGVTASLNAANKGYVADTFKRAFIRYGHTQAFENPMIGHYLPYTFDTFTDLRGYVTGPTSGLNPDGFFVDLFPHGYNGVTGDLSGNFVVGGRTAHEPAASTAGTTAKFAIGVFAETNDGITVGYGTDHHSLEQVVWYNVAGASATTGDSKALAVYPHPAGRVSNSFGQDLYGRDGNDMWSEDYNTGFQEGLTMDFQKLEKIRQPVCRVFIDSITGDSNITPGDLVIQQVPGRPEAIGRVTFEYSIAEPEALQQTQLGKGFALSTATQNKTSSRPPTTEASTNPLGFVGDLNNSFIDIQMISGRFSSVTGAGETAPYPIVSVTGGATLTVIARPYSLTAGHINMIEGQSLEAKPEFRFLPIHDFIKNMPFADDSTIKSNYTSE